VAHVQTVTGPVDPDQLGRVLSHEHLLTLLPGPGISVGIPSGRNSCGCGRADPGPADADVDAALVDAAVTALSGLAGQGIGTVVDLSPYGDAGRDAHGRNAALLPEIARRTGLNIVSGTATYREEFSPEWVRRATVDELTRRFVADATTGIGDTGVRAGILGEQPTSQDTVTALEERGLRAAARAHHLTGLSISTHTTHGTMALEQLDILDQEHVDPGRVVIGHLDNHPELDYLWRVLDRGTNIAFDSVGKELWDVRVPPLPAEHPDGPYSKQAIKQSDRTRADRLAKLVAAGHADRILLSQDMAGFQVQLNPSTHGRYGYRYLGAVFTQLLLDRGVTEDQVDLMLRANPARLLTLDAA
jgi:phosphotriesterase-related protein